MHARPSTAGKQPAWGSVPVKRTARAHDGSLLANSVHWMASMRLLWQTAQGGQQEWRRCKSKAMLGVRSPPRHRITRQEAQQQDVIQQAQVADHKLARPLARCNAAQAMLHDGAGSPGCSHAEAVRHLQERGAAGVVFSAEHGRDVEELTCRCAPAPDVPHFVYRSCLDIYRRAP